MITAKSKGKKTGLSALLSGAQERIFARIPDNVVGALEKRYNTDSPKIKGRINTAVVSMFLENPGKFSPSRPDLQDWAQLFSGDRRVVAITLADPLLSRFRTYAAATFRDESNMLSYILCCLERYFVAHGIKKIELNDKGSLKMIK